MSDFRIVVDVMYGELEMFLVSVSRIPAMYDARASCITKILDILTVCREFEQ